MIVDHIKKLFQVGKSQAVIMPDTWLKSQGITKGSPMYLIQYKHYMILTPRYEDIAQAHTVAGQQTLDFINKIKEEKAA
jgi:virulence-associated protein VagC